MRWFVLRDRVARQASEQLVEQIADLTRRELELEQLVAANEERGHELDAREQQLERRLAAVTRRELALARRVAAAGMRERARSTRAVAFPAEAGAEAVPGGPDGSGEEAGGYNIETLERLVERRGGEFPERLEEWSDHLFFLRDYAGPDGMLPADFDWLVEETFEDLIR